MTTLHLTDPLIITSRLMPGVRVGDSFIGVDNDGGVVIDTPAFSYTETGLQLGAVSRTPIDVIRATLSSCLAFLSAAADSLDFEMRSGHPGECTDLFPRHVVEWARENMDEISMVQFELDESD